MCDEWYDDWRLAELRRRAAQKADELRRVAKTVTGTPGRKEEKTTERETPQQPDKVPA